MPATLISDKAKSLKSASKDVSKIPRSTKVSHYLTNNRITWKFIAEKAPWWGGFWERMVRGVKRSLKKSIGRTTWSFEEMRTLIVEVEAVINARPLTYVHDDSEGIDYTLTPSHLIYGRKITSLPNSNPFEVVSTYEILTRRMKSHRILLWNLLKTWRKDYLLNLREVIQLNKEVPDSIKLKWETL